MEDIYNQISTPERRAKARQMLGVQTQHLHEFRWDDADIGKWAVYADTELASICSRDKAGEEMERVRDVNPEWVVWAYQIERTETPPPRIFMTDTYSCKHWSTYNVEKCGKLPTCDFVGKFSEWKEHVVEPQEDATRVVTAERKALVGEMLTRQQAHLETHDWPADDIGKFAIYVNDQHVLTVAARHDEVGKRFVEYRDKHPDAVVLAHEIRPRRPHMALLKRKIDEVEEQIRVLRARLADFDRSFAKAAEDEKRSAEENRRIAYRYHKMIQKQRAIACSMPFSESDRGKWILLEDERIVGIYDSEDCAFDACAKRDEWSGDKTMYTVHQIGGGPADESLMKRYLRLSHANDREFSEYTRVTSENCGKWCLLIDGLLVGYYDTRAAACEDAYTRFRASDPRTVMRVEQMGAPMAPPE